MSEGRKVGRRWPAPTPRRVAAVVIVSAVVVSAITLSTTAAGDGTLDSLRSEIEALRDDVYVCNGSLAEEQARFDEYNSYVDSLRTTVEDYESDERTVPAGDYRSYLSAFDEYNGSIGEWHDRAEALRAALDVCIDLTTQHNALVDSANALLDDAGSGAH